jgi:hypothetical protein
MSSSMFASRSSSMPIIPFTRSSVCVFCAATDAASPCSSRPDDAPLRDLTPLDISDDDSRADRLALRARSLNALA